MSDKNQASFCYKKKKKSMDEVCQKDQSRSHYRPVGTPRLTSKHNALSVINKIKY